MAPVSCMSAKVQTVKEFDWSEKVQRKM